MTMLFDSARVAQSKSFARGLWHMGPWDESVEAVIARDEDNKAYLAELEAGRAHDEAPDAYADEASQVEEWAFRGPEADEPTEACRERVLPYSAVDAAYWEAISGRSARDYDVLVLHRLGDDGEFREERIPLPPISGGAPDVAEEPALSWPSWTDADTWAPGTDAEREAQLDLAMAGIREVIANFEARLALLDAELERLRRIVRGGGDDGDGSEVDRLAELSEALGRLERGLDASACDHAGSFLGHDA